MYQKTKKEVNDSNVSHDLSSISEKATNKNTNDDRRIALKPKILPQKLLESILEEPKPRKPDSSLQSFRKNPLCKR